jgi:hypothetical protein
MIIPAGLSDRLPADGAIRLPGTPWSIRHAAGWDARPALEIYEAGALLDVVVPTPLAAGILRGARRAPDGAGWHAIAWGCLPADRAGLTIEFRRRTVTRRVSRPAPVTEFAGSFWLAKASGRHSTVTATCQHVSQRIRIGGWRPC